MPEQSPQESPAQDAPRSRARVRPPFPADGDGLVDVRQIAAYLSIAESSWWAWVRAGKAPRGMRFGAKCTRWKAAEVREVIARMNDGK